MSTLVLLRSSSNLAWRVRYDKSKTRIGLWCGRSHRCHGNPIFGENLLVSTLATLVLLRSSSKFGMEVRYGKSKMPIGF